MIEYSNSFEGVYPSMTTWWDNELNDLKPSEVKYNQDYYAWFKCPKCKEYTFERNIKYISTLPFVNHICKDEKDRVVKLKEKITLKEEQYKHDIRLEKARKKLSDKYHDEWKIVSFNGYMKPCILEHICGEQRKITRFNNVLKNNLKCECEKK